MFNFASHELDVWRDGNINSLDNFSVQSRSPANPVKIIADKIRVPETETEEAGHAEVRRPRLFAHLEKSLKHFSATLVTGRTGTGKTALAADFARRGLKDNNFERVAWYKADATDGDWTVFSSYFAESLRFCPSDSGKSKAGKRKPLNAHDGNESVTDALAAQFAALDNVKPLLLVLDDLHTVFDAEWFSEFFNAILSLPAPNVRVLLLARTTPPFPLLRLRSKQALDVMDEKLLAFTPDETVEFFKRYNLPQSRARAAHKIAYGKIAKLKEIAERKR